MRRIVLDTDVWSFLFKRDSRAELYRPHLEESILYVSFQTVAELYQWAETNKWGASRWARLMDWLSRFEILDVDPLATHNAVDYAGIPDLVVISSSVVA